MIGILTDDIEQIKVENIKIYQKIKALEEEFDDCSSKDSSSHEVREDEETIEKEGLQMKCISCEFCCESEITMRKHINTKHSKEDTEYESTKYDFMIDMDDMFQIEIVEGNMVYACNICDEGYDSIEEVNNHIAHMHVDILSHIKRKLFVKKMMTQLTLLKNQA